MSAEQEIREAEQRRLAAMLRSDVAELNQVLADELTYTHTTGKVDTKSEYLARLESGATTYESYDLEDIQVRVYGSTGVLNARGQARLRSQQGGVNNLALQFTNVYVQRDGRWQLVALQATRLPDQ